MVAKVEVVTDCEWARDLHTRQPCSAGLIRIGDRLIHHWSKPNQAVALPSGEAEMNASAKPMFEGIGVADLIQEVSCADVKMVYTDSSARTCTKIFQRGLRRGHVGPRCEQERLVVLRAPYAVSVRRRDQRLKAAVVGILAHARLGICACASVHNMVRARAR